MGHLYYNRCHHPAGSDLHGVLLRKMLLQREKEKEEGGSEDQHEGDVRDHHHSTGETIA